MKVLEVFLEGLSQVPEGCFGTLEGSEGISGRLEPDSGGLKGI